MTTVQLPLSTEPTPTAEAESPRTAFRSPPSPDGYIDGAWWPRSRDLGAELPVLLDALWGAGRDVIRVTYNTSAWAPAPQRMQIRHRLVRLGAFTSSDPHTVRCSDAWGLVRVDVLVIDPDTEPALAQRTLALAARSDSMLRVAEILARA